MKVPAQGKTGTTLVLVAIGLLAAWILQEKTDNPPISVGGGGGDAAFDFYLLAMTLHPAFCADGHGSEPECRTGISMPLSIHGLWPERRQPGRYPRDCAGPALNLEKPLANELAVLMPGMADRLHEHEWRKHGTCSGLDDDEYFRHTLELARKVDAALRGPLTTLQGRMVSSVALRGFANGFAPGLGATLTFHCRNLRNAPPAKRGEAFLLEIRQCLGKEGRDGAPGKPIACGGVNRRDQGCGRLFHIAAARP